MEVFKVFASFSLIDMLSTPLKKMKRELANVDMSMAGLGQRMGKLALAMAPVAVAAGAIVGVFSFCASQAMNFESAMADVAKVIDFDTKEEFAAMNESVMELAGLLPMAANEIAAIIAAAGQTGVAKKDLVNFAEQAAKMGIAFDLAGDQAGSMMANWRAGMKLTLPRVYALADAVNHLSNKMNATAPDLGEVLQRVGALGMASGLAETQVAALGTALLSAGASPQIVATAMRNMLSTMVQGESMSKSSADAFASIGFSAKQMAMDMQKDAQGTIFKVLQAIANKPKELQLSLLSKMFGESALSAIAPLLGNMDNLSQAFELVGDALAYAGSMQAEFEARSATTENALQLLKNKMTNLSISIGTTFLPAISWAAEKLGFFVDAVRRIVDSPLGQWLLKIVGGLSLLVLGVTAVATGLWGISKIVSIVSKTLALLKVALLALCWPILLVIGGVVLLYVAYKKNFGGIADTLQRWWRNITLVFKGVIAIFKVLKGSSFELHGELARDIKAAGLEGLVVNVAKIIYRIKAFFLGIWEGIDFSKPLAILAPIGEKLALFFEGLGNLFSRIFGIEVTMATEKCTSFGNIIGGVVTWALEAFATVIKMAANALSIIISAIEVIVALFTGDWQGACQVASDIWDTLVENLMSLADLFRVGDWLRSAWSDASEYLGSINLFESGAKILETLKDGIVSKFSAVKESFVGFFAELREYLPFSDAKKGPLSELTLSGARLMTTLAEGAEKGAGTLLSTVAGIFSGVSSTVGQWWDGLFTDKPIDVTTPNIPPVPVYTADTDNETTKRRGERTRKGTTYTIHIGQIVLPNAKDGKGFLQSLDDIIAEYGGGVVPV